MPDHSMIFSDLISTIRLFPARQTVDYVLSGGFAEDTSSTAIPFLQQKNAFGIYPNSATNEIHVQGDPLTLPGLIDLYGRVVPNAMGKIKTLNISSLNTGIFFSEVHNNLKTDIFKIFINK